jgi:hypothetical protein
MLLLQLGLHKQGHATFLLETHPCVPITVRIKSYRPALTPSSLRLHVLPLLSSLPLLWLDFYNTISTLLLRSLCICWSLCLECSSPVRTAWLLPALPEISAECHHTNKSWNENHSKTLLILPWVTLSMYCLLTYFIFSLLLFIDFLLPFMRMEAPRGHVLCFIHCFILNTGFWCMVHEWMIHGES